MLAGVSGRGYGARLFERAAMHASNDGISIMYIHALSKNDAMLTIARNAGAVVESDGAESEAFLRLPESSVNSKVTEILEEQMAQTDYRLKVQAMQFRKFLTSMHMDLLGISHFDEEKQ